MKRNPVKQPLIRFHRWSRKAYAAFCSVGKCVVIGYLKKGIADASLRKQPNSCTLLTARRPGRKEEWGEEAVPEKDSPAGNEALLLPEYSALLQQAAEGAGSLILVVTDIDIAG